MIRSSPPIRGRVLLFAGPAVLLLLIWLTARLWIEWQWYAEFQLGTVILRRWLLQVAGALLGLGIGLGVQLWLARIWRLPQGGERRFPLAPLPYALALLLLLLAQVLPTALLLALARRLVAEPFDQGRLHGLIALEGYAPGMLPLVLLAAGLLLLWRPLLMARMVSAVAALAAGTVLARGWGFWALASLAPDTGQREPLLGADVSFALARFPALALALTLVASLLVVGVAAVLWGLFARPPRLSDGRFSGFTTPELLALRAPLALLALTTAAAFWLGRHQLLLSTAGSVPGAGWLDVHVSLPLRSLAAFLALVTTVLLLVPLPRHGWRGRSFLFSGALLALVPVVEALVLPALQLLLVKPRELERETPYLARSIRATRQAFELDRISSRDVNPNPRLTRADVKASQATLRNIRLWASGPLLATNRQLQQLRVFYRFSEPAVDRYNLGQPPQAGRQLVIITPREMDIAELPPAARTWLNTHLVFTHGQGFTVSPVNTSGPDGLPDFFISDLGASTRVQGSAELAITPQQVARGIPIGRPSLYFGALPQPYALAPSAVKEFTYPQGDQNVYTHYSGGAGVPLGNRASRLAAAIYLREPKLLTQGSLTSRSRLLLRREVRERLRSLAPFVRFDADPYLVSVRLDGAPPFPRGQHQYWVVDGFTTSRSYPYSAAVPGHPDIRYLRNSVKAVVDAYNGTVKLYVSAPGDPLLSGWRRLFPELFESIEAMPPALLAHIRYPVHQFQLQITQLLRYHVTDPRIFYSGDDVWQVPLETFGSEQVPVRPYHVSAQLGPGLPPEFLLLQPLSPLARPNMVAWLAARSDAPHYGELVLLRFPSQTPIFGPEQITALINQNPVISQQFGLWNRSGSEVIQGNLMVVPIGQALLYVEPVYLKARQGGLPTLTRVVVSDGTRIAMEATLEQGIEALLNPKRSLVVGDSPLQGQR